MPPVNAPLDLSKLDIIPHDAADGLKDRGDTVLEDNELPEGEDSEEEGEEGEEGDAGRKPAAKKAPAKKAVKKVSKKAKELADEEEEDEEDPDPEEDEEEDEEDPDPEGEGKEDRRVPYSRLKKTAARRREAEERADKLQNELDSLKSAKGKTQAEELEKLQTDIEGLYEEVEKARSIGDYTEAAKLQRKLDTMRSSLSRAETRYIAKTEAVAVENNRAYDALLAELEVAHPEVDPDDDDFDEDLLQDVAEMVRGLEAVGNTPQVALRKAAKRILGYDASKSATQARLRREEKARAEVETPSKKVTKKKTDFKKNVEMDKKTPKDPPDDTVSLEGKVDTDKLSDEEYDKLPAATKKRLRGDFN